MMGFIGDSISPLGTVNLYVTFKLKPYSKLMLTKFMVFDILLTYNTIIDQSLLNILQTIMSTYYISVKSPIRSGLGI